MGTHEDGCAEFRALASGRLDGELDELESARLDRHLAGCAACTAWTREIAALAGVLQESQPAPLMWSPEGRARSLRWRLARGASVLAASASAAAVAAFVLAQPGSGLSLFTAGSAKAASQAPCVSCTKQTLMAGVALRTQPSSVPATSLSTHTHLTNPLLDPED